MTSEMVNPGTFTHTVGDTVRCVIKSIETNPQQHILPDFWKNPFGDIIRSLPQSLEQITTDAILVAVVVMFVCGLASYFIRNKKIGWIVMIGVPVLLAALFGWALWKQSETLLQPVKGPFLLVCMLLIGLTLLSYLGMIISSRNGLGNARLWIPFVLISVYGFLVYDIGMFTGEGISLLTNAPMAVLYAFRIFVFNSDVSELQTPFHENWLYSANFALVHFLAAGLTTLFVIKHFGYSILQRIRMWWTSIPFLPWNKREETFLFWGYNDSVYDLAQSIEQYYGKNRKAYRIIIARTDADNDDSPESRTGFYRIFNIISTKTAEIESLKELRCLSFGTYANLSTINVENMNSQDSIKVENSESINGDILKGKLGLRTLCRILSKNTSKKIHILFLSNNEDDNIRGVSVLLKDSKINDLVKSGNGHEVSFYCHARYNGPNRVIQDFAEEKNIKVKIVDSSHIAVERLKMLPEFHPFKVAKFDSDNPVTVKDPFNALIVGFGEVGRDAFRFLYEFAAFVGSDVTQVNASRSQFNCTVVDKDMDRIEGAFKASMPGIFNKRSNGNHVDLRSLDYNSDAFFTEILNPDKIVRLNYVVISIGDNDEAISLAVRIFSRFRQYGGDLSRIMILARCTDRYKAEAFQKIADHYNHGYGEGTYNTPVIRIFGQPQKTYTYELIISDSLVKLGKKFHENYRKIKRDKETWDQRHKSFAGNEVPDIDKLRKLRRKESQDMANALHIHTKLAFLRDAIPNSMDWDGFKARYFKGTNKPNRTGDKSQITYPGLSERENMIVMRLAMLEHLRWNAAHELLGYVRRDDEEAECDETTMRHNCLKNWNELDHESELTEGSDWPSDYKKYDFIVVDTTIEISKDNEKDK